MGCCPSKTVSITGSDLGAVVENENTAKLEGASPFFEYVNFRESHTVSTGVGSPTIDTT